MENKTVKNFTNLQFTMFCKDLGITISNDKELNDPSAEFVQQLFIECLLKCTNFSVEQLKNIPFAVATELGSLEKHEVGINFITIFHKVKDLCFFLGIEDFSLADMLFPEAKRNKRIFAEFANFMSFRGVETKNFENYLEISNELDNKLKKVQEEYESKAKDYEDLEEKKKRERNSFEAKELEIANLLKNLKMQIEENNYKKDAISDLERKKHELEKLIKKHEDEIAILKVESQKKREEIVNSPEKLKKKKENLTDEIAKEKEIINNKENELLILNFILKILQSLQNKLIKQISKFKDLFNVLESETNYKKELSEKKMLLNTLKSKNEAITSEANELIWNLKNMEDKSRRLDTELKKNQEHINQTLERLREERRKEEIKDKELNDKYNNLSQKLQEINKKINLTKTQSEFFYKKEEKFYMNLREMAAHLKTKSLSLFDKF